MDIFSVGVYSTKPPARKRIRERLRTGCEKVNG
jgi:hypothetical protein